MASHVPFQKSSDHYPNIISSYCILSPVDKACSPVLACICFKGPAYSASLPAFLHLCCLAVSWLLLLALGSRPQHIGASTSNASRPSPGSRRRRRPSPSTPDVLSSSSPPPLLPGLWAPVFNRQAFNLRSHADTSPPWPTTINHSTPARDTTRHAIPYHAMPCLP